MIKWKNSYISIVILIIFLYHLDLVPDVDHVETKIYTTQI